MLYGDDSHLTLVFFFMDFNALIAHWGYAALLIGCMAEGETFAILGGVAAHQGLLQFILVVLSVALGGMIGDQVLYLLGRKFGTRILNRFTRYRKKIGQAQRLITGHPKLFVIGTRFMYGFRIIGPVLIGASHLPPRVFLPLNILGAVLWSLIFTSLGYLGGELIGPWLHDLNQHLRHWIWLIIVLALVVGLRLWMRRRRKRRAPSQSSK
ncbi:putative inner membrane protein YohD [Shimwellia blattae DSM 4481 = NBRC 105725]|uniref:Putative inner membrane protein YohD n=2 Tax=Shimwellia blattae TaxID=563 RepID=I2B7G9_SHIBC|nr:putative inner membrane protein YohD [Shimwellia blattae DSM 4481 = NBRC 105725]VDY63941.1 Inner membrane protein yohD [Shimwellia blattae]VEC22077.1 Inner membrane protein yohD [Shimwellia blattae]